MEVLMFEAERFVADCRAAFAKDPTHKAIREVLARAVSDPTAVPVVNLIRLAIDGESDDPPLAIEH